MRVGIRVTGVVQGVGFRPFIYRIAVKNGLRGYVRNMGDAGVEILLEGGEEEIEGFLRDLRERKPPLARVYEVIVSQLGGGDRFDSFRILKSSDEEGLSGSVIPPDVAICEECLRELRDPENPRYDYFFITCTDCGPRYTIIEGLPYDRDKTSMREFSMCSLCEGEYRDPLNRRFHAQTVACPRCGPRAYLTTDRGELLECKDPIREGGALLSEGHIVAVKGYGGFHIATATTMDEPITRLREAKHRRQKPFAIMARSLESASSFAEIGAREAELLTSYTRPIVLLNKSEGYHLSELIAPGLHNIGVMLPYTGLHYMLFDGMDEPALVMTSANPPNEPIIKEDDEAIRRLRGTVDYLLLHNRRIIQRCDDSVVRLHGENQVFLRRSRGYAPEPILLKERAEHCSVALGGELNNTGCVLLGERAFLTQHIGDVENMETSRFLEEATKHLISLTKAEVEMVACDLHPRFTATRLAESLSEENGWRMVQVQHHQAHIASLMAEKGLREVIGISCDGYGYGLDGEAWGGEIIYSSWEKPQPERLAHLQRQPMVGGDLATIYPLRMAAGMLFDEVNIDEWLLQHKGLFPHGEREVEVILHQLRRGRNTTMTTSCGRVLDAAAAVLGICYERTYEGEPAMKLESAAVKGEDILGLKPIIKGDVLETSQMLLEVYENRDRYSKADLAYSVHSYVARGLAALAIEKAQELGVKEIGFTGGVACNQILAHIMRRMVEASGLSLLVHESVPPGDGGLSLGQAAVASLSSR